MKSGRFIVGQDRLINHWNPGLVEPEHGTGALMWARLTSLLIWGLCAILFRKFIIFPSSGYLAERRTCEDEKERLHRFRPQRIRKRNNEKEGHINQEDYRKDNSLSLSNMSTLSCWNGGQCHVTKSRIGRTIFVPLTSVVYLIPSAVASGGSD